MTVRVRCPSAACRATCTADDAVAGRQVECPKCGKSFVAAPTLDGRQSDTSRGRQPSGEDSFPALPTEFGRYRVLKLLGRGGMGAVYLANDSQLGRDVALKIPFFDAARAAQRSERFVREARSAAALRHPNICTVFDAGQIDGRAFITMEHVEGTSLDDAIDPDEPMDQARAAEITHKVALALEHAHRKGIVHRDLKPANVMLTPDGEPVVMDFGLAKRVADADPSEAKLTRDGGVVGTPNYMSPEQVRGDLSAVGPPTDVYALGAMLFEMLTGRPPYTGPLAVVLGRILTAPPPPAREFRPDADPRLEAICLRALAKDPAARFPSMAAVAQALDEYLNPVVSVVLAPAVPSPAAPASAFDRLEDTSAPRDPRPTGRAPGATKKRLAWAAAAASGLALVVWAASVILRVETPNGTLVVEIDDPAVEARIKNGKLVLSGPDGKDRYTLTAAERDQKLDPGPYRIRVEGADGLALDTAEFTLKKGDRVTVRVVLAPKSAARPPLPTESEARLPAPELDRFVPLFNGKNLDEWHPVGGATWTVEDGALVGSGPAGHLVSDLGRYRDFILRAEVFVTEGENGGVFVRYAGGSKDGNGQRGYEIDLNSPGRGGGAKETGTIIVFDTAQKRGYPYAVSLVRALSHKSGEWFTLEVRMRGNRITATVNGTEVADYTDGLAQFPEGTIALQHYDPNGSIKFRKIEIAAR